MASMNVTEQLELARLIRLLVLRNQKPEESSMFQLALVSSSVTKYHIHFQADVANNEATKVRDILDEARTILPPIAFWSLLRDGLIDNIPPAVQHLGTLTFKVQPGDRLTMREATNEIDSCRNKIQSLAYRLTLEPFNRVEIAMKWKMYCQFDEQKDILREKARKWLQDLNGIKTGLLMGEICLDRSGGSTEDEDGDE